MQMTLQEKAEKAVLKVRALFDEVSMSVAESDVRPPELTKDELWAEILKLRTEIKSLKKIKRGVKPKVESAAKVLLTDPDLAELTAGMIAEIIRRVFNAYDVPCQCKDSSIRWYISTFGLEWDVCPRKPLRVIEIAGGTTNETA